ncbi:unnamed protein product [Prorocentrum cordatum]|uniref:Uncharacterized protein n=1 Tax=Prorocentrum cordatum TaxID=2364126 RepID=A0ABN9PXM0_9DINO|nr:unnamed protein product [Polarella glacialis]
MCLPIAPLHGRSPCESECPLRPCLTPAVKTCSKQHAIVAWLCSPTEFFSFGPPAAARGTAMQRLIQRSATAGTLLVWTVTAALHGGRSGWGPQGMHFNVGQAARAPGCGVHATAGKPLGGGREAARAGQMVCYGFSFRLSVRVRTVCFVLVTCALDLLMAALRTDYCTFNSTR